MTTKKTGLASTGAVASTSAIGAGVVLTLANKAGYPLDPVTAGIVASAATGVFHWALRKYVHK